MHGAQLWTCWSLASKLPALMSSRLVLLIVYQKMARFASASFASDVSQSGLIPPVHQFHLTLPCMPFLSSPAPLGMGSVSTRGSLM